MGHTFTYPTKSINKAYSIVKRILPVTERLLNFSTMLPFIREQYLYAVRNSKIQKLNEKKDDEITKCNHLSSIYNVFELN